MLWSKIAVVVLFCLNGISAAAVSAVSDTDSTIKTVARASLKQLSPDQVKQSGLTHVYTNRETFGDHLVYVERKSPYSKYHDKPDGSRWPVTHVYAFDSTLNRTRLITPEEYSHLLAKRGFTDVLSSAWETISSPWVAVPVGLALTAYFGPTVIARWANLWNGWQRARRFNAYLLAAPQDVILSSETRDTAIGLTQIVVGRDASQSKTPSVKRFDVPSESSHEINVISSVNGNGKQECGATGTHADIQTEQPSESLADQGASDSIKDAVKQNFADSEYELVNMARTNEFAANYVYTCNTHGSGEGYGT